jgi:hypothetical protein
MPTATRTTVGRWAALASSVARRRVALTVAPALAVAGLLLTPVMPAQAALTCHYSDNASQTVTRDGFTFFGQEYAGFYSGSTATPSKTQVTSSGAEAQCLLLRFGHSPGTIDGVFGNNSQAAMKAFQRDVNSLGFGNVLAVDGLPGTHSWPWLRALSQ